jgi:predicted nucleic acid-binding protein
MKRKVYIETSIVSYLIGRPSRDLVTAAHQELTLEWWTRRRPGFDVFVSSAVLDECARGDKDAVRQRLAAVEGIPVLEVTPEALELARFLVKKRILPAKAGADALHIALAGVHGMDFLLTWNCRHIANAEMRFRVEGALRACGFDPPALCTPEELMGGHVR